MLISIRGGEVIEEGGRRRPKGGTGGGDFVGGDFGGKNGGSRKLKVSKGESWRGNWPRPSRYEYINR